MAALGGSACAQHLLALICFHIEEAAFRMVTALIQAVTGKFLIAFDAVKLDNTGKELPEEVLPRDFLCPERQDEFVEFEAFIGNVWRLKLAMSIHKDLALLTELPPALARSEERGAMCAPL